MLMTSSLMKIFRFKKQKEVDGSPIKRNEESRYSLRSSPVPTWRPSKDAIYIGGTSWSRPSAPYSIVTAPKKCKSTRSCPGLVSFPPFRPLAKANSRYFPASPDRNNSTLNSGTGVEAAKQTDGGAKTSEYGSCEPSPTSASQPPLSGLPDSDYDNDCAAQQLKQYAHGVRKLKRRMKEERHRHREQIVAAQNEAEHMRRMADKANRALAVAQRTIESERHRNQNFRRRLREAEALIVELREELSAARPEEVQAAQCACCCSSSSAAGAGEALCALSQSNSNLFGLDFSSSTQLDLPDEVRNFRVAHCDTPSAVETPRSSTPTFQNDLECVQPEIIPDFAPDTDFGLSEKQRRQQTLRRSFSDSELPNIFATLSTVDAPQRVSSPTVTHPLYSHGEFLDDDQEIELEAICSSDEDFTSLALIGKQLRKRGDVVRFMPPRRTVREAIFRHFGRKERNALAEFDYLHELSTDASAIASSPDYPSPEQLHPHFHSLIAASLRNE